VSDGTNSSLMLAKASAAQRDLAWIERTIEGVQDILRTLEPGLWNWLRILSLSHALTSGKPAEKRLTTYLGADTRLQDLPGKVTLVSYRVRDAAGVEVFHNYGAGIANPLAVEVAMESGAFPVVFPLADGHVDGGLFANTPAAVAVAQVASPLAPWSVPL